jgi:hypothetical protein
MGKINIRQIIKEELSSLMYYIIDEEGMEPPIGPLSLMQASSKLLELGAGHNIVDEKTAKEIYPSLSELNEMARAKVIYSVTDKPSLEKVVDAAKGNTKMALQYLLDKGEMAVADLAKELKKDPAAFNNPGFRKLMSDLADRNVVSMGTVGSVGASSALSAPKVEKPAPKVDMSVDAGEDFEKEIPSDIDVMAGEKEFGDATADTLGSEEKAKFEKLNTAIRNKVAKLEKMSTKDRAGSPDLAVVKQIINKPEVKKLFRSKGIDVMDLVSSVIG